MSITIVISAPSLRAARRAPGPPDLVALPIDEDHPPAPIALEQPVGVERVEVRRSAHRRLLDVARGNAFTRAVPQDLGRLDQDIDYELPARRSAQSASVCWPAVADSGAPDTGQVITEAALLIIATAVAHGLMLVTSDVVMAERVLKFTISVTG